MCKLFHSEYVILQDKPPQWTRLNDLSYVAPGCPSARFTLFNTDLLLSWNVVLSGSSTMSEVVPFGKWSAQSEWQVASKIIIDNL